MYINWILLEIKDRLPWVPGDIGSNVRWRLRHDLARAPEFNLWLGGQWTLPTLRCVKSLIIGREGFENILLSVIGLNFRLQSKVNSAP